MCNGLLLISLSVSRGKSRPRRTRWYGTHLILTDGIVAEEKFLAATNFEYVTSDVRRHTFLLLLGRYIHRANLASDRLRDHVLRRGIKMHLHRDFAAFANRRHNPQAD